MESYPEFVKEEANCENYKPIFGEAIQEPSSKGNTTKRKIHPLLGITNKCIKNTNKSKKTNNCSTCNLYCPKNL